MEDQMVISIVVAAIVLFVTILVYWLRKKATQSNTILLVGLTDSGKTLIFSKLITGRHVTTYTSMKENEFPLEVANGRRKVKLVDVPGADRLRQRLQSHWLGKEGASLKGIVCVVDSATFSKRVKDVAEFLYDVLYNSSRRVPVLVACNKQDKQSIAKSAEVIKTTLEKEFGLINVTRESALASTDGDNRKRTLTSGKSFAWTDLKRSVQFVECAAVDEGDEGAEYDLSPVEEWMGSV